MKPTDSSPDTAHNETAPETLRTRIIAGLITALGVMAVGAFLYWLDPCPFTL